SQAQVGTVLHDRPAHLVEVRGAAAVVDVEPVGFGVDGDDRGACLPVGGGPDLGGGAVGAVDHDGQPAQIPAGGLDQVLDVALVRALDAVLVGNVQAVVARAGGVEHAADARAGRADRVVGGDQRFDAVLDGVVELVPARGEDLDPVVRHGIVRGG